MNTQRLGHEISEDLQTTAVQNVVSADPKMLENASPLCFIYWHTIYFKTLSEPPTT
jgi:hypothetical protein